MKLISCTEKFQFRIENFRIEKSQLKLFGHGNKAERLRKGSPNKLFLPKQMKEKQLNDLEINRPMTLKTLDGIARDFTHAK